jgi:predicted nucleic acid-binding protein
MIHFDTNYLIGVAGSDLALGEQVAGWLRSGETLGVNAVAWSEFLTGPFTHEQLRRAETVISKTILPFGKPEAECAARIYNQTGRKRDRRIDCMIAAAAICARVPLATLNQKDFLPFVPLGLKLA